MQPCATVSYPFDSKSHSFYIGCITLMWRINCIPPNQRSSSGFYHSYAIILALYPYLSWHQSSCNGCMAYSDYVFITAVSM